MTSGARADFVVTAVRTGAAGSQGISLIVVPTDTPGFTVAKTLDKLGWRSSDTAELVYQDVRVPIENLVGEENKGFQLISQAFVTERLTLASQAYATAQRCLDLAIQWTRDRETFGQPLITRQAVEGAEWVVYQAQQLFGGLGYITEAEVEKHYRDIRILAIGGGTTEILMTLAAKKLGMVG
ncbi:acyl-CoA dehydrogenase family protein [Brevibacterium mcbrellneri]|uniref:acyl-CoA dehydrogenase family protein n=1 Tax=Brevibacterium mcbrellneri TaxID=53363 RepID=UPI001FE0C508